MARTLKKSGANELVATIKNWGDSIGESDDPYINQLSSGLAEGKDLDYWADLDPADFLPIPVEETPLKIQRRVERFFLLRSSLVFLPVAVTWLSVAQAAASFTRFVNDHPSANTNFLIFWNHSHGYIPRYFELQSIADLDFIIIFSAIAINIIETRLQRITDKQSQQLQRSQMAERTSIILEIQRYLRPYRKVTPVAINQGIQSSLRNLSESQRAATLVTKNLNLAFTKNQKEQLRLEKVREKLDQKIVKRATKE